MDAVTGHGDAEPVIRFVPCDEVSGLIGRVVMAADQQSSALAPVNRAIAEMDRLIQQNTAIVEQTSAAAASLTSQAESLAATPTASEPARPASRQGRAGRTA